MVNFEDIKKNRHVVVTNTETGDSKSYLIPFGSRIRVHEGDVVEAGARLTEGSVNPHDVLTINGAQAVQDYLIQEVQRVYRMQGVDINDKHIEVIVRQMMRKVRVEDAGSTGLLPASMADKLEVELANEEIRRRIAEGENRPEGSNRNAGAAGYHQSLAGYRFVPVGRFVPGNDPRTDRCCD